MVRATDYLLNFSNFVLSVKFEESGNFAAVSEIFPFVQIHTKLHEFSHDKCCFFSRWKNVPQKLITRVQHSRRNIFCLFFLVKNPGCPAHLTKHRANFYSLPHPRESLRTAFFFLFSGENSQTGTLYYSLYVSRTLRLAGFAVNKIIHKLKYWLLYV